MKPQPSPFEKPLWRLRKQLSNFASNPAPEDVHLLRTHTRRLEATMTALSLKRDRKSRRLLKLVASVRNAAGKVRDMDVLIGHTLTLPGDRAGEQVVLLVEHLAKMRIKQARKLYKVVRSERQDLRKRLKDDAKLIRKKLSDSSAGLDDETATRILINELSTWPNLTEENLHLFRIRIKELRYVLQLGKSVDESLLNALGEVKDTIGKWHDWVELLKIARKVLGEQEGRPVLTEIERVGAEKLQVALSTADRVREHYLDATSGRRTTRKIVPMAS